MCLTFMILLRDLLFLISSFVPSMTKMFYMLT